MYLQSWYTRESAGILPAAERTRPRLRANRPTGYPETNCPAGGGAPVETPLNI
jgi:hypothetical protein